MRQVTKFACEAARVRRSENGRRSVRNCAPSDSIRAGTRTRFCSAASPLERTGGTRRKVCGSTARIFIRPTRQPAITYPTTRGDAARRSKPRLAGRDPVNTRYAAMNEWKPVSRRCNEQSAPGQRRNKTGHRRGITAGLAVANSSELRDSGLVSRSSYPRGMSSPATVVEESRRTSVYYVSRRIAS